MSHMASDTSTPRSRKSFISLCLCQALAYQANICGGRMGSRERKKERDGCACDCGYTHLCMCDGPGGGHSVPNSITVCFIPWRPEANTTSPRSSHLQPLPLHGAEILGVQPITSCFSPGFCGFKLRSSRLPNKSAYPRSHHPSLTHLFCYFE